MSYGIRQEFPRSLSLLCTKWFAFILLSTPWLVLEFSVSLVRTHSLEVKISQLDFRFYCFFIPRSNLCQRVWLLSELKRKLCLHIAVDRRGESMLMSRQCAVSVDIDRRRLSVWIQLKIFSFIRNSRTVCPILMKFGRNV
jgi:hypothetical protein